MNPAWLTTAVTAALSAVLSSGVTAAYLRAGEPDVLAVDPPRAVTPEQQSLAALLVAPAAPYRPVNAGAPVDAKELGADGLESLGFRRGWSRTWRTADKDRVDSFVLEFEAESGARSYAQGIGRVARLLAEPEPFTVTGVPGSSGLADTVKDRDGNYAQVVVMHSGARAVLLVFANDSARPGSDVLTLAQRQWAALSAT